MKVLLYTTKIKNKINLTSNVWNAMRYSVSRRWKSWFCIFKMTFCSVKICTINSSSNLFVWVVKTTYSELSKCEIGFKPYGAVSSKMVSRNYPFEKKWFWGNYEIFLDFYKDINKRDININQCACVNLFFKEHHEIENRKTCLIFHFLRIILNSAKYSGFLTE